MSNLKDSQHYTKPPTTSRPKPPLLPNKPKFTIFKSLTRDDPMIKPRHHFVQSPAIKKENIGQAISTQRSSMVIIESAQQKNQQTSNGRENISQFCMRQSIGNSSTGGEGSIARESVSGEGLKRQINIFAEKLAATARQTDKSAILIPLTLKTERNTFTSNIPPKNSCSPLIREGQKKRKRWEDLYQEDRLKRDRLIRQSSEYESFKKSIEFQQCTFQPQIQSSKSTNELIKTRQTNDLYQQGIKWKRELNIKIKLRQNEMINEEMSNITFKPQINPFDRQKLRLSPIFNGKQGPKRNILEGSMRAMEQFISRMTRAKIENESKLKQASLPRNLPQVSKSPQQAIKTINSNIKNQMQKSSSQLSLTSSLTPKSATRSVLNFSKLTAITQNKIDQSSEMVSQNKISNDITLCTSLYLQNKYAQKKTPPKKMCTPNKRQEPVDMKIQSFERALQSLHCQIQNFNV